MPNTDMLSGILVLVVTFIAWTQSRDFSYLGGMFVNWILVVLGVLGTVLLATGIIRQRTGKTSQFSQLELRRVVLLGAALCVYLVLIYLVGFALASVISYTLICSMLTPKENRFTLRGLMESAGTGLVVTISFYVLFKYVLLVPLPGGIAFG